MIAVRALDPEQLAERVTVALRPAIPDARVNGLRQLVGGASGLTYSADLDGRGSRRPIVIKSAPPGLEPIGNRDVLRQACILEMLADVPGVAVPDILVTDIGFPPAVPPFYVMSLIAGESYEPQVTIEPTTASPDEIESRAFAAATMAAALHAVSAGDLRLADEPVADLHTELARWAKAFAAVDRQLSAGSQEVLRRLSASIPEPASPSIVHGDFRLGNMLCSGASINAIIDWEIWSINDPRLDLAWFLLFATPGHPHAARTNTSLPAPDALADAYVQAAGRPMANLEWFGALARYKQAAASALVVRNNRKLPQPGVDLELLVGAIPKLLHLALDLLN